MEVLVDQAAGMDVHKETVMVCVMATEGRKVVKTLERYPTFHRGLVLMREIHILVCSPQTPLSGRLPVLALDVCLLS